MSGIDVRKVWLGILLGCGFLQPVQAQEIDSVAYNKWVNDVVVTAKLPLYQNKSDVMIYNVSRDSSLLDKDSYEALKYTPMIIAERNGNVRSIDDSSIEYLVNGLHDNALSGNIHDALESLPAKYLKRIEVRRERTIEGKEMLQVNFVTKGRLMGYRGLITSTLHDDRWRSGAYAFTKYKRIGMSLCYYNTWTWGHNRRNNTEEHRENDAPLYTVTRNVKQGAYRTDLHSIECNLSYEVSPLKAFTLYGCAMYKSSPHSDATTLSSAQSADGLMTYAYRQDERYRVSKDAEYTVTFDYEWLFGEEGKNGKFYAEYEYYRRPVNAVTQETYTDLEYSNPDYVSGFYDMTEYLRKYENWHSFSLYFRRKLGGHELFVEELLRYRNEEEDINKVASYNYRPDAYTETTPTQYDHDQLAYLNKMGYAFSNRRLKVSAGGTYAFMHDISKQAELHNRFSFSQQYITPYISANIVLPGSASLYLSYGQGRQVPSIGALNPYVYTNVPGEVSYGNPNLKTETSHAFSLSPSLRVRKVNLYGSLAYTKSSNLILEHTFLQDNLLHRTKDNLGKRDELKLLVNASSKCTRTTWARIGMRLFYTNYRATSMYQRNDGFTFTCEGSVEQELPHNFDLSVNGGYNTPWIFLQGEGGRSYYYGLRLDKSFPRRRITIGVEANSFIPVHYTKRHETRSEGYSSITYNQYYQANFQVSVSWRFGKLKAQVRETDKVIDHNDIKQDFSE
jgi:hypothetical protein